MRDVAGKLVGVLPASPTSVAALVEVDVVVYVLPSRRSEDGVAGFRTRARGVSLGVWRRLGDEMSLLEIVVVAVVVVVVVVVGPEEL